MMRFALSGLAALSAALTACEDPGTADARIPTGAELYRTHCAACHGLQADGQGPVAAVMSVDVPSLRTLSQRNAGTFPRDAVTAYIDGRELPAAHGERQMPIWGLELSLTDDGEADDGALRERRVQARLSAIADFLEGIQYR